MLLLLRSCPSLFLLHRSTLSDSCFFYRVGRSFSSTAFASYSLLLLHHSRAVRVSPVCFHVATIAALLRSYAVRRDRCFVGSRFASVEVGVFRRYRFDPSAALIDSSVDCLQVFATLASPVSSTFCGPPSRCNLWFGSFTRSVAVSMSQSWNRAVGCRDHCVQLPSRRVQTDNPCRAVGASPVTATAAYSLRLSRLLR